MSPDTRVLQIEPSTFAWESRTGVAEGVRRTVSAATGADGGSPLDEAALLSLRHKGLEGSSLWVAGSPDDRLTGFVLADAPFGSTGDHELNLVVAPGSRSRGIGRALASAALAAFPGANLSAWSHGNHLAAAALASDLGFDRVRDLWVMRRSLDLPLPALTGDLGASVVRPFEPGRDEEAFLEVNAAAFAHHPEQGDLTRADLDLRMAEDWFDPAGFFLATAADGRLLGFHWTKVHAGDPSYGEVYVVGVAPEAQGSGLGKTLTLAGLQHLRSLGLGEVILYVESDNDAAVAVYRGLGFSHAEEDTHVMYRRDGSAG
ncbi:MAG TPA: mycothiol synthase [Nocardioidaceae bacterium]|nr:mycothiol synthase [Nocardioidaceae bacterium]